MAVRMSYSGNKAAKKAFHDEPPNPTEDSMSVDLPDVELAEPKSPATEGTQKKEKKMSGAKQLLDGLKQGQTSSSEKMIDKQMEFATKLALYEAVRNEQEVEKAEAGLLHVLKVPRPLDWIKNAGRPPLWSTLERHADGDKKSLTTMEQLAKITKTNSMKYINIVVHPHLLKTWYIAPLVDQAKKAGVRVVEGSGLCHRVIGFSRVVPREITSDTAKTMRLSPEHNCCRRFLYILQSADMADYLKAATLALHMERRKHLLNGQITLLILDTDEIIRKECGQAFEMTVTELVVALEIDTLVVRSADELIAIVLHFAKALAEEPLKLSRRAVDEQAEFYMRGDNKNCVAVDQQGNGLARLWQQMLSVLPHSSLEVSRAITAEYSSPRLLAEALSTQEGQCKVADIGVARSAVPGAKSRRLGPEMSHKLHKMFLHDGARVAE